MNGACVDRFASWFAYHLSNFQFRWSWDDWSSALTLDPLHSKPKFIRETLLRCMRLSYHDLVLNSIPESFQEFAPESPTPENKYTNEGGDSLPGYTIAMTLMNAMKKGPEPNKHPCSPEEALAIIKELPNPLMETEDGKDGHQFDITLHLLIFIYHSYRAKSSSIEN